MIIGIIGGGQLARMMILAGYPLGLKFIVLDPSPDACASQIAESIQAEYDDEQALRQLAEKVDVITFEFENIPNESIRILETLKPAYPPSQALKIAQDRLNEKNLFKQLEIPVPGFSAINSRKDLDKAVESLALPLVIKTRTLGYDGKGQFVIKSRDDIDAAWDQLGGVPLIAEQFVPFKREVSIIAVRGRSGETAFYPIPENTHQNGILHLSICKPNDALQSQAEVYARRILNELDYVGVMALELFEVDGQLLANEIAPRVHNSGHWSIEGSVISQFENHLRAVAGLPLGSTKPTGFSAMINFVGTMPELAQGTKEDYIHFHDYGKEPRPGRKIGHATVCADSENSLQQRITSLQALLS